MDDTFDFRPYVDALFRRWRLLLGGTLLAGILAVALSFLLPSTYESSALVLVVEPRQIVQFDPRFETVDETRPLQAYPELADSDSILQSLLRQITPEVREPDTLLELREIISVSASNDPSLLRLSVRHHDPVATALIANRWAEIFVTQVNEVLGDQGSEQVQFFIGQRDEARHNLDKAEQALGDFQATNRARIITAELQALEKSLALYLAKQQETEFLQRDILTLRAQLAAQNGELSPADPVAALLLYLRAFGEDQPASQVELQIDGEMAATADREQLIASLDTLQENLQAATEEITDRIGALEPQILALQGQLDALASEENRLQQEMTLATETYTALARQVAEQGITSQDTSRGLRLSSPAIIPEEPVAPRKFLNGVLAAVTAFVALVAVILFRRWREE